MTATRTARTADETLASVSVITRADIERTQAKSVAELLAGEAGIDTTVSGGYGKSTSVFLRGTNSDHTLVLIDGIKVGSATLGTAPGSICRSIRLSVSRSCAARAPVCTAPRPSVA